MSEHRYARRAIFRDYARGVAGVVMTLALIVIARPSGVILWVLAGLASLFVWFLIAVALKQATLIRVDQSGVRAELLRGRKLGPIGALVERRIAFDRLQRLTLRVFGRKRARGHGVVELTLKTPEARLVVEGSLDGFGELAEAAAKAALTRGLRLDDATHANLLALGYAPPDLTKA